MEMSFTKSSWVAYIIFTNIWVFLKGVLSVCLSVTSPFFLFFFSNQWAGGIAVFWRASPLKQTNYIQRRKNWIEEPQTLFLYPRSFPHHLPKRGQTLLTALWSFIHYSQRHSFVFISLKRSQLPVEDLMDVLSVFVHIFLPQTTATHHPHPDLNPNNTPDVPTSQHVPPCRYCNALDIFLDVCFVSKQGVANQELFIVVALNSVCTCLSTTQAKCFLTYSTSPGRQAGRQASRHDYFVFCPF